MTIQSQYRYHDSISLNDILNGLEWAVVQPNLTRVLHRKHEPPQGTQNPHISSDFD